jgi:hypothetical protein
LLGESAELGRYNSVAGSRTRFDHVRPHAALSGRLIKRSGRSIKGSRPVLSPVSNQPRNHCEAKIGSAIKKYERTIIPFNARTGEKTA